MAKSGARLVASVLVSVTYLCFGATRTLQGPTLPDLADAVNSNVNAFKVVFMIGTFTFPLGNYLAGLLIDHVSPTVFLSVITLLFGCFYTLVPFIYVFAPLTAVYTIMEFFMGALDTCCNVISLQLWSPKTRQLSSPELEDQSLIKTDSAEKTSDEKKPSICDKEEGRNDMSGPFLAVLHFCFALGNILGPVLADMFLHDSARPWSSRNDSNVTCDGHGDLAAHSSSWSLTDLQHLHLIVGSVILLLGLFSCFIPSDILSKGDNTSKETISKEKEAEAAAGKEGYFRNKLSFKCDRSLAEVTFLALITSFFLIGNGINFAFSNFLTVYVMRSALAESKSFGARATTLYFVVQTMSRFMSIFSSFLMSPFLLTLFSVAFLHLGAALLLLAPDDVTWLFLVGVAFVGIGTSNLFPSGLAWIKLHIEVTSQITALFLISTSIGAQLFKVPVSVHLEDNPRVLFHMLAIASSLIGSTFVGVRLLTRWLPSTSGNVNGRLPLV